MIKHVTRITEYILIPNMICSSQFQFECRLKYIKALDDIGEHVGLRNIRSKGN